MDYDRNMKNIQQNKREIKNYLVWPLVEKIMIVNAARIRYSTVNPVHHTFYFTIRIQMITMKHNKRRKTSPVFKPQESCEWSDYY